jgi:hypothetical protein
MWLALVLGLAATTSSAQQYPFTPREKEMAANWAKKIAADIAKRNLRSPKVAVFPFGDQNGKVTGSQYETPLVLQGELIYQLLAESKGNFLVLSRAGLQNTFRDLDLQDMRPDKPEEVKKILEKANVDVALVGRIDRPDPKVDRFGDSKVTFKVIYRDGPPLEIAGEVPNSVVPQAGPETVARGRFNVELLIRNKQGQFAPVPLVTSKDRGKPEHNVVHALLPADMPLGTPQAEFQVRISNNGKGKPLAGWKADTRRLVSVVLTVDGVNSIYEKDAEGNPVPVCRHPWYLSGWILCGPGEQLQRDDSTKAYRLVPAFPQADGSTRTIKGFQLDGKTRANFTFASASQSIAEQVGPTHEIGVITAYFYAEMLKQDDEPPPAPPGKLFFGGTPPRTGAMPGRLETSNVFSVKIPYHEEPVEVWRIFYRQEGDAFPIPEKDRIIMRSQGR